MSDALLAAVFVMFAWWASTGAVLLMDGLPRSTFRFSVAGASLLAAIGLAGLYCTARHPSRLSAYVAFGCALAVWAWHELTFLLGLVTGPRKTPCPTEARGWTRFRWATAAVIHHELLLVLTLAAVIALTWGAPNQVGTGTFVVLWAMRLSAKLNVFLGVRNLSTEFIPKHLRYLVTYFRKAPMNPLMPVSLVLAGAALLWVVSPKTVGALPAFSPVGSALVATILALAILEHVFLVVPVPDALLWRWAVRAGHGPAAEADDRP